MKTENTTNSIRGLTTLAVLCLAINAHAAPLGSGSGFDKAALSSGPYEINPHVLDAAGGTISSGSYSILSSTGQPGIVGSSSSGAYQINFGFVTGGGAPFIEPILPDLTIDEGETDISIDLDNYANDQDDDISTLTWEVSVDGGSNYSTSETITNVLTASIDGNNVLSVAVDNYVSSGAHTLSLRVTDPDDQSSAQDITVNVVEVVPSPPQFGLALPDDPNETDDLICTIGGGSVATGLTLFYIFEWDNGQGTTITRAPTQSIANTLFDIIDANIAANENWTCEVKTYDGVRTSAGSNVIVFNQIAGLSASTLTLTSSTNEITLGSSVTLTANIDPDVNGALVNFDDSTPPAGGSLTGLNGGNTNSSGVFSDSFVPNAAGAWSFEASWAGNTELFGDSGSTAVSVAKALPAITLDLVVESGSVGLPTVDSMDPLITLSLSNASLESALPDIFDSLEVELSVQVFNEDFNGSTFVVTEDVSMNPIVTNGSGDAVFLKEDLEAAGVPFGKEGTLKFQGRFVGNSNLLAANSLAFSAPEVATLELKSGAGYAIICVGELTSGEGKESHNFTADFVYRSLLEQDFDPDDIYYMRQGSTPAGSDNISDIVIDDSTPTEAEFLNAIADLSTVSSWASSRIQDAPAPLYVIMIDHGLPGQFFIDGGGNADTRLVDPPELAAAFATFDSNVLGTDAEDVARVIVYGACNSGSFIPFLSGPNRVVITAAASDEESHRGIRDEAIGARDGELFTTLLFQNLREGRRIRDAFIRASTKVDEFTLDSTDLNSAQSVQTPLLDDNGDGEGSPASELTFDGVDFTDGGLAQQLTLGISANAGESIGWFSAEPVITLTNAETLTELDAISQLPVPPLTSAWIAVKPPSYAGAGAVDAGDPDNAQLSADLSQRDWSVSDSNTGTGLFRWSDNAKGTNLNDLFTSPGAYQVYFYLRDGDTGVVSSHVLTTVYRQQSSPTPPGAFSLLFPADNATRGITSVYGWTASTDADGPVTYEVQFAAPGDTGFTNVLAGRAGITSTAVQLGAADGIQDLTTYIWRVVAYDPFGASTASTETFTIDINQGNNTVAGLIGDIRETNGAPISNATVSIIGPSTTNVSSESTGRYVFNALLPGSYGVTVSKAGYITGVKNINISEDGQNTLNFTLLTDGVRHWGDVSGDEQSGTVDASYIIQWRTTDGQGGFLRNTFPSDPGFDPTQAPDTCTFTQRLTGACTDFPPYADVDGDGELAIQDAIEILQVKIGQGSNQPYLPADATDASPNNGIYDVVKRYDYGIDKGGARNVSTPSGTAMPSEIVDVPIEIDNADGVESMTIILEYDSDVLTAVGAERGDVTSAWTIFEVDTTSLPGAVIIQGGSVIAASGSGALANVMFEVKAGTLGLDSPLTLSTVSLKPDIASTTSSGTLSITDGSGEPNDFDWFVDGQLNSQDIQTVINLFLAGGSGLSSTDVQATINAVLGVK